MESQKPRLNYLNFLNAVGYVGNIGINYAVGASGVSSGESIGDVSSRFQTIVSPASWAFSIWGLIFLLEGIFVVAQFLPRYRSDILVQKGVNIWHFLACIFQAGWVVAFSFYANILVSLVLIWLVWFSLLGILVSQYHIKSDNSLVEHVILKLPFNIHFGWLTAASLVNVNLLVVKMDGSIPVQLAVGLVSLAALHGFAVFVLFGLSKPYYALPAVFTWAIAAISSELKNPEFSIVERFDSDTITGIQYTATAVACIILFHTLKRLALCFINKACINVSTNAKESFDGVKTLELVKAVPASDDVVVEHEA